MTTCCFWQDVADNCDEPIRIYVLGFIGLLLWFSFCQNRFIKYCLRFDPASEGPERPFRVQFYHALWQLTNVGWNIAGFVWVLQSETCAQTAPHMYESAKVLVFLQLTVYILIAFAMGALIWMVSVVPQPSTTCFDYFDCFDHTRPCLRSGPSDTVRSVPTRPPMTWWSLLS